MTKKVSGIILAFLLAGLLIGCDKIGLGAIKESRGSLDGSEVSFFVLHLERGEGGGDSFSSSELRAALDSAVGYLEEMGIEDFEIGRRDNGSLRLTVKAVDEEGAQKLIDGLTKVTRLDLHKVSERSEEISAEGKTLAQRVLDKDEIVVGQKAYMLTYMDMDGNEHSRPILLYRRAAITSADLEAAFPSPQQPDAVSIVLDGKGADKMIALTQDMRPGVDRIAIVLNGEVVSAPVVNMTPLGKRFIIEGLDEPGEVDRLAAQLMHPTSKPFRVEQVDKADD